MKAPKVLISILNWNAPINTANTVRSVLLSEYKNYSILILDNNSSDNSVAILKESFPAIQLLQLKSNLGYAGAHKVSAKVAIDESYDLFWILNNDVIVYPSTLQELVNAYKRNGDSLFGSIALDHDGHTISFGGGFEMLDRNTTDEKSGYNQFAGLDIDKVEIIERRISGVEGSSFLIPINIIKNYGFINTRYFLYGEETEYCFRLRKSFNIQSIIVPASRVIHYGGQSFKSEKLKWVRAYYSARNNNMVLKNYMKEYKVVAMDVNRLPHYFKYFFKHYFFIPANKKDFRYWMNYYDELGNFHSFLRIKGKYLKPEKYLK